MDNPAPSQRVYMTGLPPGMDQARLLSIFGAYGKIEESALLQNGAAILKFSTLDEATWFVHNLNGNMPEGLTTPVTLSSLGLGGLLPLALAAALAAAAVLAAAGCP